MNKIVIEKHTVENSKVNKKILVISDIHFSSKKDQKRLDKLIKYLKNYTCDYICIPGDFINNGIVADEDVFVSFIAKLAEITKVIISLGNHDTMLLEHDRIYYKNEQLFKKICNIKNVKLLDNDVYETSGIRFIGLTLPNDYYNYGENGNYLMRYTNNVFDTPPKNLYNIVLCHSPLCINKDIIDKTMLFKNTNLIITGHTHSCLTPRFLRRFLKGKGFATPYRTFFPKYNCYGEVNFNKVKMIISSGVLKFSSNTKYKNFNFLFDVEMLEINLVKQKKTHD